MSPSRRRLAVLVALVLVSGFDIALVYARMHETRSETYWFLIWNLILAWIPLLLALAVYDGYRRRGLRPALALPALGWLLFFPNAPYLVTDFVHLRSIHTAPVWFDVLMVGSFAFTGLVLGFVSLALVHAVVQRHAGSVGAWSFVLAALALCSVGVYLGRFLRFNSWSVLTRPGQFLEVMAIRAQDPLGNPMLLQVVGAFTCFLAAGYLVVWTLAQPAVELDRRAPRRR